MRNLTKADKKRGVKLRELGCIVCYLYLDEFTQAAIHHIDGKTKPGCHQLTIGLCDKHHQIKDNQNPKRWVSLHGDGRKVFNREYLTENKLLMVTNEMIGE